MSRKPKKGYFVKGQFVAEGSELDLELKLAMKWGHSTSKTDAKRESVELQQLGEQLLDLRGDLFKPLPLPDKLADALNDAKRITNFEGKRRQMQFIGKLMRQVDPEPLQEAVANFKLGGAQDALALHQAEQWREALLADDQALTRWMTEHPDTDAQPLRALIRQARLEVRPDAGAGVAQRQGRHFRDLFQFIKTHLKATA